jgi:hypothetical protein
MNITKITGGGVGGQKKTKEKMICGKASVNRL